MYDINVDVDKVRRHLAHQGVEQTIRKLGESLSGSIVTQILDDAVKPDGHKTMNFSGIESLSVAKIREREEVTKE